MEYQLTFDHENQQFISIELFIDVKTEETTVQLPTWRPGRYQEADFAKNVKGFKVFNDDGKSVGFSKTNKTTWLIDSSNTKTINVSYKYYAVELNAGSSFLNAEQLYINPVNCFLFVKDQVDELHTVSIKLPQHWQYAGPLKYDNNQFTASSYDELADSPFICSPNLQYRKYTVQEVDFYIWFNGIIKPEWDRLIDDFKAFTLKQIEKFTEFPTQEYHFLIQILPYKGYHGVEHKKCTVITLGPSYDVFGKLYKELLGVSSHELYHTWNVKAIRPIEMYPYDFVRPNYTKLGYVAEGVTTYQGDLMLFKSGVFSLKQYLKELAQQFQKHFDNFGRFNYSVGESSWDTWLDGYELGIPGRKVSIYTEGCLLAFALDVLILKATDRTRNLDVVMRALYFNHALKNKGITENEYLAAINNTTGEDFSWFFDQYYNGTKAYETLLMDCLDDLGLSLESKPSKDYVAAFLGVKGLYVNDGLKVKIIYPGSGADLSGMMVDDTIVAVNSIKINRDLDRWLQFFHDDEILLTLYTSQGILKQVKVPHTNRTYFRNYEIIKLSKLEKPQQNMFDAWIK
jgi:predicted metalloprotease with PDZ domain